MAGATVLFSVNDAELKSMLAGVAGRVLDLTPAMKAFGEYMVKATDDRFRNQVDPKGAGWKKLSDETVEEKQKHGKIMKILQRDGYLRVVHAETGKDSVTISSDRPYAAIHQKGGSINKTVSVPAHWRLMTQAFGKKIPARSVMVQAHSMNMNVTIPKREFLGFSDGDVNEFTETVKDWLILRRA